MGMKIFEASGTFKPSDYGITADTRVDIVVVGGGQGGDTSQYITSVPISFTPHGGNSGRCSLFSGTLNPDTTYPVTVGSGGAGGFEAGHGTEVALANAVITKAENGGASSFGTLVSADGGSDTTFEAEGGITDASGESGGAGGFIPNYTESSFGVGGNQYIELSYGMSASCPYTSGGTRGVSAGNTGVYVSQFGGAGGIGLDGQSGSHNGAAGGKCNPKGNSSYRRGGGGGGGGYGAGGGQGGTSQGTTSDYVSCGDGGKGANGVVIVFW